MTRYCMLITITFSLLKISLNIIACPIHLTLKSSTCLQIQINLPKHLIAIFDTNLSEITTNKVPISLFNILIKFKLNQSLGLLNI